MARILIVRLSALGDIIHTIPAFSCLRKARKDDTIGWVVSEKGRDILEMLEGLDEIVSPSKPGRWDVSLDFQGLLKSGLISLFSAKKRYGFSSKLAREPLASVFYTYKLESYTGRHIIEKNLALATLFLGRNCDKNPNFPLKIPHYSSLDPIFHSRVILNTGASWENKRIPSEKLTELCWGFKKKGLNTVLLWGSAEELKIAREVAYICGGTIAPPLSIKEVFYAIKKSLLLISGDSFPLHVASALGKKAIGIFGPTDPARNGPLPPSVAVSPDLDCHPCWRRKCDNPLCMNELDTEEIMDIAFKLLSSEKDLN